MRVPSPGFPAFPGSQASSFLPVQLRFRDEIFSHKSDFPDSRGNFLFFDEPTGLIVPCKDFPVQNILIFRLFAEHQADGCPRFVPETPEFRRGSRARCTPAPRSEDGKRYCSCLKDGSKESQEQGWQKYAARLRPPRGHRQCFPRFPLGKNPKNRKMRYGKARKYHYGHHKNEV